MNRQEVIEMIKRNYVASLMVVAAVVGGVTLVNINRQNEGGLVTYADVPVGSARLAFSKTEVAAKVDEQFSVDVLLTTGTDGAAGADLIVRYDPKLLEVVDANANDSGIQIADGKLFGLVPFNSVTLATGLISFSAVQQPKTPAVTTTDGKLATITFKSKAAGAADLTIESTPGQLDDSNVIKAGDGRDLLNTITNASVTVSR